MRLLQLNHDDEAVALELRGTYANVSHYDEVISDDTVVLTPNGDVVAVLVTDAVSAASQAAAYEQLKKVPGLPTNRGTAVYKGSMQRRVRNDGKLTNTITVASNVIEHLRKRGTRGDVLGFLESSPRVPYCRQSAWTLTEPQAIEGALPLIREVDACFATWVPDRYATQKRVVEQVPEHHIHGTVFTTITVNKNWRTAYHQDKGDLRAGFSCITTLGEFEGGFLVMPRYRVAFDMRPGSIILYDAHEFHGNMPIFGERIATVLYCREKITRCAEGAA